MQPTSPSSPVFFEATSQIPRKMAQPIEGDTLDQLQTPEQVALLDTIDELRSQGLSHHGINLPQLIVCGDQSSGKSSLLEGLTRLRFPTADGACTTFATEVVLRRNTTVEITIEITPSKLRSQEERCELAKFKRSYSSREDFKFQSVHDEAKGVMAGGVDSERGDFFEDVLRVRYSGPDMPSFTIVDLPGLFAQKLNAGSAAAERVEKLVTNYMANERSIILAVVQAKTDLENQRIFTYLEKYDPKRSRSLGIITKPDTADRGSSTEKKLIRLAKNEEYPLKYQWHTVKNRAYGFQDQSDTERDKKEEQFFTTGLWTSLPRKHVGISALRAKLSHVLLEHIGMELPSIVTAIQGAVEATESSLKALGHTRETSKEQRTYLTGHATEFQMLTRDALGGNYSNKFFALTPPYEHTPNRLRTAIQNLNIAFAHVMYQKGHTLDIAVEQSSASSPMNILTDPYPTCQEYGTWFKDPARISRAEYLELHIGGHVRQSRPSGLPSLVNPLVVRDVFRCQSKNWGGIAKHHLQQVFKAVGDFIEEALGSLIDPRTRSLLMLKQIQPELDRRWRNLEAKFEELLVPYTEQEPITYDPGFIQDLEELRAARHHTKMNSKAEGMYHFNAGQSTMAKVSSNSSQRLLTESIDEFTNSEILDLMQTYYKRAISVFINNIAVLAIENCLLKDLSSIFSPTLIANMDDEQLHDIAAECEEVRDERSHLRKKLEVLESGKKILGEHIAKRPASREKTVTQAGPYAQKDTTPHTPKVQTYDPPSDGVGIKRQDTIGDLSSKMNNLVVTPPSSASNSRRSSRQRVDSINSNRSWDGGAKKPPFGSWPHSLAGFGEPMRDESDDD